MACLATFCSYALHSPKPPQPKSLRNTYSHNGLSLERRKPKLSGSTVLESRMPLKPVSASLHFGTFYSKKKKISPDGVQEEELLFETHFDASAPLPPLTIPTKPSESVQYPQEFLSRVMAMAAAVLKITDLLKNSIGSGGGGGGGGEKNVDGDGADADSPPPRAPSLGFLIRFASSEKISLSGYVKDTQFELHGNVSAFLFDASKFLKLVFFNPVVVQAIIATITKIRGGDGGGHGRRSSVGAAERSDCVIDFPLTVMHPREKLLTSLDLETVVFKKEKIILDGHDKV